MYAVDPVKFGKLGNPVSVDSIMSTYKGYYSKTLAVCLTGGEPLVQPKDDLLDLIRRLKKLKRFVTIESAATIWSYEIADELDWISLSPKLPSALQGPMKHEVIEHYLSGAPYKTQFKFVVKDDDDQQALIDFTVRYYFFLRKNNIPVIIQPCDNDMGILRRLISIGMDTDLNVRFLPQLHKILKLK
jgi:organic radical activating enzyme